MVVVPLIFDIHITSNMVLGYFRVSNSVGAPPWLVLNDDVQEWLDEENIAYRVIWQGYERSMIVFERAKDAVIFKLKF